MVTNEQIENVFNNILVRNKCATIASIKERLSTLSQEEKNELLKGKLNPFEQELYDYAVRRLPFINNFLKSFNDDISRKAKERFEKIIFDCERKCFQKKIKQKPIPDVNIDDYESDEFKWVMENENRQLETDLINNQTNINFTYAEENSLKFYFNENYKLLNGEIYKTPYWEKLPDDLKIEYSKNNRNIKRHLNEAFKKVEPIGKKIKVYHGVPDWDFSLNPGDHFVIKGYNSCSFNKNVGKYYSTAGNSNNKDVYREGVTITYLVPETTKGICGNVNNLSNHPVEHELLLNKGSGATIISIDWENREVIALLDE